MRFESITLGDFGCFYDARLEDLQPGLTVIAGPQRAGKTTFMRAVRQLGYGIRPGANLPPAADRYDLSGIVAYRGDRYELSIDHHAAPAVVPIDDGAPDRTPRELFGGVRREQYRQLYTISLDELTRDPETLEDDVELARILLSAGFGELRRLPDIIEAVAADAYDIGRTTGQQGGPIREAIETIEDGIEAKDAALAQVDAYAETEAEKARLQDRLADIDEALDALDREETRLTVAQDRYEDYQRLQELQETLDADELATLERFPLDDLERVRTLADQYRERREQLRRREGEFATLGTHEDPAAYREALLEARTAIERYTAHLERYRRDVERLRTEDAELAETEAELIDRVEDLHPTWTALADVRSHATDLPAIEGINQDLRAYRELTARIEDRREAVERLETQLADLDGRIDEAVDAAEPRGARSLAIRAAGATLGAVLIGGAIGAVNSFAGVAVTAAILVLAGGWIYWAARPDEAVHDGVNVAQLRAQQQEREADLSAAEDQLAAARDEREAVAEALEGIGRDFDLPADTDPNTLETFLERFADLHDAVRDYDRRRDQCEDEREELHAELQDVGASLAAIGIIDRPLDEPVGQADELFTAIERAADHLEAATALASHRNEVRRLEQALHDYLVAGLEDVPDPGDKGFPDAVSRFLERGGELEALAADREERERLEEQLRTQLERGRIADAFAPIGDGDPWAAFTEVMGTYESTGTIADRLEAIATERASLETEREEQTDARRACEQELETLASDADVRAAHRTIQSGRTRLEDRLETYARYRIAERLLETLQERYLDRTTGPLLEEASAIMERITDGTYTRVESTDEFEDLDFRAYREADRRQASTELSRATAEQLFLAVRLARIERSDDPLPVLLDDSLTNFDPGHVHRSLDLLGELADDHQMFLLTCHPRMIDHVAATHDAQYYYLEDGRFDDPTSDHTVPRDRLLERSPVRYPPPDLDP